MSRQALMRVERALSEIKQGRMVVVVDDELRENEGDLIMAAEHVTADSVNFMIKEARGLVCLALPASDFERLEIPMMHSNNRSRFGTPFGVSIEAAVGVTTGISAHDRACTIQTAIRSDSGPNDIAMPGHIFPLRAQQGGVLQRDGHTEAAVDLARLSGLKAAGVICEIINDDGSMARLNDLRSFAQQHQLQILSIKDLQAYRMYHETVVSLAAKACLPIDHYGEFEIQVFYNKIDQSEHVVLSKKPLHTAQPCLVRLHSECLTGDVFHSQRCDCGKQLDMALAQIAEQGGHILYLRQEGRGIGLVNKIKAYALQQQGMDTVEANLKLGFKSDERDYGVAAQILRLLGLSEINLLTNNPAKIAGLQQYGIQVVERTALEAPSNRNNIHYLQTKLDKMQHLLTIEDPSHG